MSAIRGLHHKFSNLFWFKQLFHLKSSLHLTALFSLGIVFDTYEGWGLYCVWELPLIARYRFDTREVREGACSRGGAAILIAGYRFRYPRGLGTLLCMGTSTDCQVSFSIPAEGREHLPAPSYRLAGIVFDTLVVCKLRIFLYFCQIKH